MVCQMPRYFSRSAGFSPRVSTASKKLFGTVSATVSVAGLGIISPSTARHSGAPRSGEPGTYEHRPFISHKSVVMDPGSRSPDQDPGRLAGTTPCVSSPHLALLPAALAARAGFLGAEIELLDILALHQPLAGIRHHDPADLEHIAALRRLQRHPGVLLDQQHGDARFGIEPAADGEDLLLAAREQPGTLIEPRLEHGEIAVDALEIGRHGIAVAPRKGAHHQVFAHAQERKDLAAFGHVREAEPYDAVGIEAVDPHAIEFHAQIG